MAKKKASKATLSKKKKSWFQIIAPEIFAKAVLGESIVEESSKLVGKRIKLSLMTLTGDMKKQNVNVSFEVDKVIEGKAHTRVMGYEVSPASIKRMVRRGRERVDASFVCQTKDGVKVRVKPFLLTIGLTNKPVVSALRKQVATFLATYFSKYDYDTVFKDIVSGKVQLSMMCVARKVYPIRTSEIRGLMRVKDSAKITALPHESFDVEKIAEAAKTMPRPQRPKRRSGFRRPFNRGPRR